MTDKFYHQHHRVEIPPEVSTAQLVHKQMSKVEGSSGCSIHDDYESKMYIPLTLCTSITGTSI